jgi:MFS family permease
MVRFGRKRVLMFGNVMAAIGIVGFGAVYYVNKKEHFTILSFVFRFITGVGDSCFTISGYAMIAVKYPKS